MEYCRRDRSLKFKIWPREAHKRQGRKLQPEDLDGSGAPLCTPFPDAFSSCCTEAFWLPWKRSRVCFWRSPEGLPRPHMLGVSGHGLLSHDVLWGGLEHRHGGRSFRGFRTVSASAKPSDRVPFRVERALAGVLLFLAVWRYKISSKICKDLATYRVRAPTPFLGGL